MDGEYLADLIDRHAAALVLYARQWCAAPEDIVQEAFFKLVLQTTPPDQVVPWLYRVVRNGAISASRSARRRQKHETIAAVRSSAWFLPAEGEALDAETAAVALRELPLEQREAIVAHLWGGLTFEQIGEIAGTSPSTVYRRYAAGLSNLRTRLRVPCPSNRLSRT
jgi:RNA polymerase sigma-70 factor (ECF subfamily)